MSAISSKVQIPSAQVGEPAGATPQVQNIGSVYEAVPTTVADGEYQKLRISDKGEAYVIIDPASPVAIEGPDADNAAATGNPLQTGGVYSATPSDHSDGDVARFLTDIKGRLVVFDHALELLSKGAGASDSQTLRVKLSNEDQAFLDGLEGLITSLNGYVDGLEALVGTTNTSLSSIAGYVDGLEGLIGTLNGYVDGIESLIGTTNTSLTSIAGYVDGLEGLATSLNGFVDGLETLLGTTNASLAAIDAGIPAALGQTTKSASMPVVLASDQDALTSKISGKAAVAKARNDYSSVNVTTSAYVQLVTALSAAVTEVEIFDSSGQTLLLAVGAAASEVDQVYIIPGGNGRIPLSIASGARVSIKAVSALANAGEIDVNFYGA